MGLGWQRLRRARRRAGCAARAACAGAGEAGSGALGFGMLGRGPERGVRDGAGWGGKKAWAAFAWADRGLIGPGSWVELGLSWAGLLGFGFSFPFLFYF